MHSIAIIGAGFAGLATAKTLRECGFSVQIFEKDSEVGGVWSSNRRYPGLTTQNVRSTYALSDFPYPSDYPEWPSGEQVQKYLSDYARHFGLDEVLHLGHEVRSARQDPDNGSWILDIAGMGEQTFDFLIVCNGIYSDPYVPDFDGADAFRSHGGRICHTVDFHEAEEAADKHLIVIGYGKSSCDVATASRKSARSTRLVARRITWKIPPKFKDVLNFKWLLMTRMGENLFPYFERRGMESFLHGPGLPVRNSMLKSVEGVIRKQLHLEEVGLLPDGPLETIVMSTVSLATPGFFDAVRDGEISVNRDAYIERLEPGTAILSTGERVPADVIVCGTGFHQRVPFLPAEVQEAVTDTDGNFRLYRQILPVGVSNLAFNGYNSSFFSQLNAEMAAAWIAAYLHGDLAVPTDDEQDEIISRRLDWTLERTRGGNSSKGTSLVPFSMHNVDELLKDLDLTRKASTRAKEWLNPIDPRDYASVTSTLRDRYSAVAP